MRRLKQGIITAVDVWIEICIWARILRGEITAIALYRFILLFAKLLTLKSSINFLRLTARMGWEATC